LDAIIRPYATKIAGIPISMEFQLKTKTFSFTFYSETPSKCTKHITEIYLPQFHYQENSFDIQVSDGTWTHDANKQTVYWKIDPENKVETKGRSYFWTAAKDSSRNVHAIKIKYLSG
jgi:hypothetical protein